MNPLQTVESKLYHAQKYLMMYVASRWVPIVLVTEYPRSGGGWFCELLSSSLNMYFPRHSFQRFKPSLYHGHYLPSKNMENISKIFLMIRDGRDVMISNYYKNLFFMKNGTYSRDVHFYRKLFGFNDFDDIKRNLPRFLHVMFTLKPPKSYRLTWDGNWVSFNEAWLQEKTDAIVRYEDLRNDTAGLMRAVIDEHFDGMVSNQDLSESVETYSFRAKTGREPGSADSHATARKGIIGDYKNHFSREAAEIFNHYAGHLLKQLGYEEDDTWIKQFS